MNSIQKKWLPLILGISFIYGAFANDRYVTDILYVPMRAGPGTQYKIIHQGVRTGTKMQVLNADAGNGFSQVITSQGLEGYIRTQYLIDNPPARQQLPDLQAKAEQAVNNGLLLSQQLKETQATVEKVKADLLSVQNELETKERELKAIAEVSADTLAIDQRNKRLIEDNLQLKDRVQLLEVDNGELMKNTGYRWFLYGGGTLFLGVLVGVILPRIKVRKKQASDWV